jgi:hypothetical protein
MIVKVKAELKQLVAQRSKMVCQVQHTSRSLFNVVTSMAFINAYFPLWNTVVNPPQTAYCILCAPLWYRLRFSLLITCATIGEWSDNVDRICTVFMDYTGLYCNNRFHCPLEVGGWLRMFAVCLNYGAIHTTHKIMSDLWLTRRSLWVIAS